MIKNSRRNSSTYVKLISFMGIMIALQFVTEYSLSLTIAERYRISFTFLLRAITGYCIGWLGGIVSAITDVLGGLLLYGGSMNPGITLTRFLQGLTVGLILYRKSKTGRIIAASVIDNLVLSMILNTYFIFTYMGTPFTVETITPRVIVAVASFAVEIAVLLMLMPKLLPTIREFMYKGLWSEEQNGSSAKATDKDTESTDTVEKA
ncbi:MAG: folate family ECF transporter S component [Lachnospiraceae bacterium]|nr:folate family ECF transporter S component [Lachnospiraceae bacterium]